MKVLAISREIPPVDWSSLGDLLKEEARSLHALYQEGHVREFYFTPDGEAVLILESPSTDAARSQLARLPLVRDGKITFEITELLPYNGFERLFPAG